ncbi:16S rRNA (adenine(1518)-N(6)/adenine(1519)-N(6))-dimethyltransferase RsmA [Arcticibacterium luteifluviistationis]|uniref:Ribosomal RNA small subunit methyltransferase A n=1 Tax=Arcticibacterium luteifluviistationis TaxID=1784714 RepID=A0A2Z4GH55_9BACT|nr:16S rRNA (adenine(1518)-N(6)/adenine(1519)-N(6))-dimethyltransferase RsmA [Arcticibacterium luteifluviistationis]AWW00532.1 16S rRNA (adenine(1518)-N(6)/adenine(1519)-N(6))-dimethyltransferase [Arcticibacterium luteifluviistationis]
MAKVRAKKHLGQHFLINEAIAEDIVDLILPEGRYKKVLEIGPGMGVLTKYLLDREDMETHVVELDGESVVYLNEHFPALKGRVYNEDVLNMWLTKELALEGNEKIGIIGNFPYNISSQIFFKVLQDKDIVDEVVCMLQKEVAERIASKPGSKKYGILSVLLQAYYDIDYHINVPPISFDPPPKVDSGVIRLVRNKNVTLDCDERKFFTVVKTGFNQRRKMLSNALKPMGIDFEHPNLQKRAEQLTYQEFVELTNLIS